MTVEMGAVVGMDPTRRLRLDLQAAYDPGVFFSYTYSDPSGRMSRSAVVPVVIDRMASKKVTDHCGHASKHFYLWCRLPHAEISDADVATWPTGLSRNRNGSDRRREQMIDE